jgi:hypothetical protein
MTKNQKNRAEMFDAVKAYLDANTSIWSLVPIIGYLVNLFNDLIVEITSHKEAQNSARVFIHKNKKEQKRFVADKADILNDALYAFASIEEDAVLESKADKSFSDLYKLTNDNFVTVINETITLLDGKVADLADYGVNKNQIKDLKNSFDNFLDLNGKPRQFRISSVVATATLEELFQQSHDLLIKKLDKVMKRFKNTNPTFYKGYLSARVIVDN